jgi:tRNA(fMet)-specific endonuclease VapC
MEYLLDTSWIIEVLAGREETVRHHKNLNLASVAVSHVSMGEIYEVAFNYANPHAHLSSFRQFLAPYTMLSLNEPIMEKFAEVRAHLRRRGQIISDFDILLGATALHYNLTVLTYNRKHFQRIPDIKIYQPKRLHSM